MSPFATGSVQPLRGRDEQIARLRNEAFDLAVIGGGINGAAVARDASIRGMKVALLDKGDFAGETSSRSSKLIHGGLRYLAQGQLTLVYRALRERERLRYRTAPHLVHPIRFLFPFYRGSHPGWFAISTGLILYDLMARTRREERHQRLGANAVKALEPTLSEKNLLGGAIYHDAWGDDARLTIENALDAAIHGAAAANYLGVEGFARRNGRLNAAAVIDLRGGSSFEVRARCFVNAAGPWVDDIRRMDDPQAAPAVRLTKGVHLVVESALLGLNNALVLEDGGGRIVFVVPRDGYMTIGTTDTDFTGERERVVAEPADINYLLEVVARSVAGARLDASCVAYSFAGLRALMTTSRASAPSAVSREEVIIESPSGLISVAGGKLTTHREIAARVVNRVCRDLGAGGSAKSTGDLPLPGVRECVCERLEAGCEERNGLDDRYGTRAALVRHLARQRSEWAEPLAPGCPVIGAEVVHAVRNEFAVSVSDFLIRRTSLVWRAPLQAVAAAPAVARIMASELGWDREREDAELEAFRATPGLMAGAPCATDKAASS